MALGILLLSSAARAWTRKAEFEAHVHGHAFTKVTLESAGCSVSYRLEFEGPPGAYPKTGTGFYRFHARIKLDEGRTILTPTFINRTPGKRTYAASVDTTADGCWGKADHKVFGVDVEGCRGRTCVPDPFQ